MKTQHAGITNAIKRIQTSIAYDLKVRTDIKSGHLKLKWKHNSFVKQENT